jgi:hypothetical protein
VYQERDSKDYREIQLEFVSLYYKQMVQTKKRKQKKNNNGTKKRIKGGGEIEKLYNKTSVTDLFGDSRKNKEQEIIDSIERLENSQKFEEAFRDITTIDIDIDIRKNLLKLLDERGIFLINTGKIQMISEQVVKEVKYDGKKQSLLPRTAELWNKNKVSIIAGTYPAELSRVSESAVSPILSPDSSPSSSFVPDPDLVVADLDDGVARDIYESSLETLYGVVDEANREIGINSEAQELYNQSLKTLQEVAILAKIEADKEKKKKEAEDRAAKEKAERERIAKVEAENAAAAKAKRERAVKVAAETAEANEKAEVERIARVAAEKLAREKVEKERAEKAEQERAEKKAAKEKAEKERAEKKTKIDEKVAGEKAERERLAKVASDEKAAKEREELERLAKVAADERAAVAAAEKERLAKDAAIKAEAYKKADLERIAKLNAKELYEKSLKTLDNTLDSATKEEAEIKKTELIKKVAADKAAAAEKAQKAERELAEKAAAAKVAAEKAAAEKAEREAVEKAAKEKAEREAVEKAAKEQAELAEKAAAEKAAKEQAELAEKAAAEKAAKEQAERQRIITATAVGAANAAKEAAVNKVAAENAEAKQLYEQSLVTLNGTVDATEEDAKIRRLAKVTTEAAANVALERVARETAEREQAEREQAKREQAKREQAERETAEREQAEREQAARETAEREQAEREQAEREQAARETAERERVARETAESVAAESILKARRADLSKKVVQETINKAKKEKPEAIELYNESQKSLDAILGIIVDEAEHKKKMDLVIEEAMTETREMAQKLRREQEEEDRKNAARALAEKEAAKLLEESRLESEYNKNQIDVFKSKINEIIATLNQAIENAINKIQGTNYEDIEGYKLIFEVLTEDIKIQERELENIYKENIEAVPNTSEYVSEYFGIQTHIDITKSTGELLYALSPLYKKGRSFMGIANNTDYTDIVDNDRVSYIEEKNKDTLPTIQTIVDNWLQSKNVKNYTGQVPIKMYFPKGEITYHGETVDFSKIPPIMDIPNESSEYYVIRQEGKEITAIKIKAGRIYDFEKSIIENADAKTMAILPQYVFNGQSMTHNDDIFYVLRCYKQMYDKIQLFDSDLALKLMGFNDETLKTRIGNNDDTLVGWELVDGEYTKTYPNNITVKSTTKPESIEGMPPGWLMTKENPNKIRYITPDGLKSHTKPEVDDEMKRGYKLNYVSTTISGIPPDVVIEEIEEDEYSYY